MLVWLALLLCPLSVRCRLQRWDNCGGAPSLVQSLQESFLAGHRYPTLYLQVDFDRPVGSLNTTVRVAGGLDVPVGDLCSLAPSLHCPLAAGRRSLSFSLPMHLKQETSLRAQALDEHGQLLLCLEAQVAPDELHIEELRSKKHLCKDSEPQDRWAVKDLKQREMEIPQMSADTWEQLAANLSQPLQLQHGSNILMLGCGSSKLLIGLQALQAIEVSGIDTSEDLMSQSKASLPHDDFCVGDVTELGWVHTGSFDQVVSLGLFEWLPSKKHASNLLQQMMRVLKPDGCALIGYNLNVQSHFNEWSELLADRLLLPSSFWRAKMHELKASHPGLKSWIAASPLQSSILSRNTIYICKHEQAKATVQPTLTTVETQIPTQVLAQSHQPAIKPITPQEQHTRKEQQDMGYLKGFGLGYGNGYSQGYLKGLLESRGMPGPDEPNN